MYVSQVQQAITTIKICDCFRKKGEGLFGCVLLWRKHLCALNCCSYKTQNNNNYFNKKYPHKAQQMKTCFFTTTTIVFWKSIGLTMEFVMFGLVCLYVRVYNKNEPLHIVFRTQLHKAITVSNHSWSLWAFYFISKVLCATYLPCYLQSFYLRFSRFRLQASTLHIQLRFTHFNVFLELKNWSIFYFWNNAFTYVKSWLKFSWYPEVAIIFFFWHFSFETVTTHKITVILLISVDLQIYYYYTLSLCNTVIFILAQSMQLTFLVNLYLFMLCTAKIFSVFECSAAIASSPTSIVFLFLFRLSSVLLCYCYTECLASFVFIIHYCVLYNEILVTTLLSECTKRFAFKRFCFWRSPFGLAFDYLSFLLCTFYIFIFCTCFLV